MRGQASAREASKDSSCACFNEVCFHAKRAYRRTGRVLLVRLQLQGSVDHLRTPSQYTTPAGAQAATDKKCRAGEAAISSEIFSTFEYDRDHLRSAVPR